MNYDPNNQYNGNGQYGQEPQYRDPYLQSLYNEPHIEHPDAKKSNGLSIAGFICGIVGLGMPSLAAAIVGLILSTKGKQLSFQIYGEYNKLAKTGFILSLIGTILSACFIACVCTVYGALIVEGIL